MSDVELSCTPPEVREIANVAVQNLLPKKSKTRYNFVYSKFVQWCKERKVKNYTENCLLAYFESFNSKKSLWSTYSMLKSCLNIYDNIDISRFNKLIAFLKRETEQVTRKKSKILEEEHIQKFMEEAPDSQFLLMKVVLIMGISGACRREELCKMSVDDIEFKTDVVCVTVPDTKNNICRRFAVTDVAWIRLLLKYKEIRNSHNKRFFLTYRNGKCVNCPVGLNTFGKIPSKIAEYLKLENSAEYTGHCFRRSSATLLANHGGDLLSLKSHGGWKSSAIAESYVENSLHRKKIIVNKLMQQGPSRDFFIPNSVTESYASSESANPIHSFGAAPGISIMQPGPSTDSSMANTLPTTKTKTYTVSEFVNLKQSFAAAPGISISNCQNVTINVYKDTS